MVGLIKNSKLNGIIQIALSLFWVWHFGRLLYLYHFTDIAFFFKYPNWTLILFIIMGLFGSVIGLLIFREKIKIKNGYLRLIGLFVIGLTIDLIVVS
tara:strand:- start:297 stop:587 length:291 start_codon:yes stop_codon:yes gene_type:complete